MAMTYVSGKEDKQNYGNYKVQALLNGIFKYFRNTELIIDIVHKSV